MDILTVGDSSYRLNFDLAKKNEKKTPQPEKKHLRMSKTAKIGCAML
jgi:hypothetical protein